MSWNQKNVLISSQFDFILMLLRPHFWHNSFICLCLKSEMCQNFPGAWTFSHLSEVTFYNFTVVQSLLFQHKLNLKSDYFLKSGDHVQKLSRLSDKNNEYVRFVNPKCTKRWSDAFYLETPAVRLRLWRQRSCKSQPVRRTWSLKQWLSNGGGTQIFSEFVIKKRHCSWRVKSTNIWRFQFEAFMYFTERNVLEQTEVFVTATNKKWTGLVLV